MPEAQQDRLRVVTYRQRTTGIFATRRNRKFKVINADMSNISEWGTDDEIEILQRDASEEATVRNITDSDTIARVTIEGPKRRLKG